MTRSTLVGSALALLLVFSVISYSKTFIQTQEPKQKQNSLPTVLGVAGQSPEAKEATAPTEVAPATATGTLPKTGPATTEPGSSTTFVVAPQTYTATAYSLRGRTASGRPVSRGLIAADPSILPLGSRVRVEAGSWTGEYLVADTGGAVKGRRIDIWTPSTREAMQFGRRTVKLTVLEFGTRRGKARSARPRLVNAVNLAPATVVPATQPPAKRDK
jgi:3D (Asp-Asp-Asp) domain-containing protein